MRLIKSLVFLALAALMSMPAVAADYYIDITNDTGYTMMYLYVSPGDAKSWEDDVLGNDVMKDGSTTRVNLKGYSSPIFDIRLIDTDGDTYTFWDVNVAKQDLTVTLDDLD